MFSNQMEFHIGLLMLIKTSQQKGISFCLSHWLLRKIAQEWSILLCQILRRRCSNWAEVTRVMSESLISQWVAVMLWSSTTMIMGDSTLKTISRNLALLSSRKDRLSSSLKWPKLSRLAGVWSLSLSSPIIHNLNSNLNQTRFSHRNKFRLSRISRRLLHQSSLNKTSSRSRTSWDERSKRQTSRSISSWQQPWSSRCSSSKIFISKSISIQEKIKMINRSLSHHNLDQLDKIMKRLMTLAWFPRALWCIRHQEEDMELKIKRRRMKSWSHHHTSNSNMISEIMMLAKI